MSAESTEHPYEPTDLGDYPVAQATPRWHEYPRIRLGRAVVRALGFEVTDDDSYSGGQVRIDPADEQAVKLRAGSDGEISTHAVGRDITCGPRVVEALGAEAGDRVVAYDRGDHVRLELVDDAGGDDS